MKSVLFFRSLTGFGLLLAAGFTLWFSIGGGQTQGAIFFGEIFVVNSTADDHDAFPGDGNCETQVGNGVCTLRAALEEVIKRNNGHDGIGFDIPTSDPGCPATGVCIVSLFNSLPDITVSVSISGPGSDKLFIDGSGDVRFPARIFNVTTGGTVSISGLTIAYGITTGGQFGAGIQNVNSGTINLTSCALSRNKSEGATSNGGGGGGIYNASSGTLNITNCVFRFNSGDADPYVGNGGGIWNKTGTVNISNSTFDHNQSSYRGGAISNEGGVVTVTASTFYGNGAAQGGAIASDAGTMNVTNCTFYANIGYAFDQGVGGGIMNFNKSVLNLTNSTVTGNFSNYAGSGVFNDNTFGAIANVKSTIIASNYLGTDTAGRAASDVYGAFTSAGFNLIGKKDGSSGFTAATDKKGTVVSPLNPRLDPRGLRNNGGPTQTIALVAGSPAIDKGTRAGLTGTLSTDQRGFARTVDKSGIPNANGGDGTDIGAFEFGAQ